MRPTSTRPLDGTWEIAGLPPGFASEPAELEAAQAEWMPCTAPMPAAAALRACGAWDFEHPRDFDADDWWYRCRFTANCDAAVALRFSGLATVADAWLNGRHILHSENMFVAHTVEIPSGLPGESVLILRFHALAPLLKPRSPRPKWRARLVSHQGLRWYRTSLLGRMPAWCPPVAPVGPWRPILIDTGSLRVGHTEVRVELEGDDGVVRASLDVDVPSAVSVRGTISVGDSNAPLTCEALGGARFRLAASARVTRPDRWWPHTHGAQPLYQLRATLFTDGVGGAGAAAGETIDLGRVGFRTISVDRGLDGRSFGLVVNGTPVFCRGVCWTPLDIVSLSASPSDYRAALGQLRDAGMNMVRVGGTMTYEAGIFHDLCDELGILVFQDFMFANMDYPWEDETFARTAKEEVMQALEALQSRPSLAVLCGGSEVEQQRAMLGLPQEVGSGQLVEKNVGLLVQDRTPGVVWLPDTPCGGTFPFQVDSGVSHYYGVGAYRRPFEDARRAQVRFASECLAFSNVSDASTAPSRVPRDAGADWDFADVRDHYMERLFDINSSELRAREPERYLALARVASGEAMLRTFAEWRRPGSTCSGGLVWFARDLWPSAGWGVIDSDGRPKAAYWYLKRACAPVALFTADEGLNGVWIHAVNDTAEPIEAVLRLAIYYDSVLREAVSTRVSVPARGHHSVHADALFDRFRDLTYAYRFGSPVHDVIAASLHDARTGRFLARACYFPGPLPAGQSGELGLTVRPELGPDGYALVLTTKRFAHAVAIDVDGFVPDDNYLNLEPGATLTVRLRAVTAGAVPRGRASALNGLDKIQIEAPTGAAETVHVG